VFLNLKYTSPSYVMEGVGKFRFVCRFPSEAEMLDYGAEVEQIAEKFPADTPNTDDLAAKRERRKAISTVAAKHALGVIEALEYTPPNGDTVTNPDGWKEEWTSEGRPGFAAQMLAHLGFYLFRGATEQSALESEDAA